MSPIDSPIPYYPVNEFGPLMKGLVIGGVGILHVFLAQFAIGGGMLMWYFERLGQRGRPDARTFVDGYFKILVLIALYLATFALHAVFGWAWAIRRPDGPGLTLATAATAAAHFAGTIVREAPRLALIERSRATAAHSSGIVVFFVTLAIGIAAITGIVRTVRGAAA